MAIGPYERNDASVTAATGDDPTARPLLAGTVSDRCVSCGTSLSGDQRYCVACGERRGQPRFALGGSAMSAGELVPTGAPAPASAPRPPRASSGTTIVAGVGTLLLAMGVGVLIGRNSASPVNSRVQAAAPTVVTVGGGAGTGTVAVTDAPRKSRTTGSSSSKHPAKSSTATKATATPTAAQAQKASAAASKVLGSGSQNLPPATVTVGQTGHGPGYNKKGKFTGSFFGP